MRIELKVLLAMGIILICIGLVAGAQTGIIHLPGEDLPRYTEAQVITMARNYVGDNPQRCSIEASYEGNGIWEVKFVQRYGCEFAGKVVIFDEKTGALH